MRSSPLSHTAGCGLILSHLILAALLSKSAGDAASCSGLSVSREYAVRAEGSRPLTHAGTKVQDARDTFRDFGALWWLIASTPVRLIYRIL